jgi:hypothetical protein
MRTWSRVAVVLVALAPLAWGGVISVGYLKTVHIQVPGATAAYSLDPLYAEASAAAGDVAITGKNPGEAKVVVVTPAGVQTLSVTIPQPPPSYPPGFVPPTPLSYYGGNGRYEFRYSSDPSQWVNTLQFIRRHGSRRTELRVTNATMLRPSDSPGVSFPMLSYSVSGPRRGFTVLDDTVDNSALTVDGAVIRGFHYRQGGWNFHAGFASQTSFRDFLLSTERQEMAGISRSFHIGRKIEITPNVYYFHLRGTAGVAHGGTVASIVYRYKASEQFDYSLEVGAGRGVAFAGEVQYSSGEDHLHAQFRNIPQNFAGLELNQIRGQTAQVDWTKRLGRRLSANVLFTRNSYAVGGQRQSTLSSSGLLRYELLRHWTVNGGAGHARFAAGNWSMSTLSLPVGTDFATAHFGIGVQYQFNHNAGVARNGYDARANVRAGFGPVQVSAFYEQQTEAPRLQAAVSQNSALADTMNNQAVMATTPGAIAAAMHDNAVLASLGYAQGVTLGVAARRRQFGANLNWARRTGGHEQLTYSFLRDMDDLPGGRAAFTLHTLTFTRRITDSNEAGVSLSLYPAGGGRAGYHVQYQLDFRHRFDQLPSFFAPNARGSISGHVFRDDAGSGEYASSLPGVADVEVVLDGQNSTRSDEHGFYMFPHVTAGPHRIEAITHTEATAYFTTNSSTTAEINSQVNFGLAYALGHLFGAVRSDAGEPLGGVTVRLSGLAQDIVVRTGDDGEFDRKALPDGTYTVSVDPDSVPAGYWLGGLKKQKVTVHAASPVEFDFQLKATRAVVGRVIAYDAQKGREVPVPGAVVTLRELRCAVLSDRNGVFRFKDLPAGDYTAAVVYKGREVSEKVTLPAGPALVSDLALKVGNR